jgi:hypothetical protein
MQALNPNLGAALAALGDAAPTERVDLVYVFPARPHGTEKESGLAVLALRAGDDDGRREVWTLQYEAERQKGGRIARTDTLLAQGEVPADRVERIIDGVVRRLGGAGAPDVREVRGDPMAWAELLAELGVLDAAS